VLQTLVLARLLPPAEVGVFAAGTLLSGVLLSLTEGGPRGALIQRETDVEDAADTVFWAGLVTGTLMSLALLAVWR
jgi:O-antigen/teichoic acid export membrane protein